LQYLSQDAQLIALDLTEIIKEQTETQQTLQQETEQKNKISVALEEYFEEEVQNTEHLHLLNQKIKILQEKQQNDEIQMATQKERRVFLKERNAEWAELLSGYQQQLDEKHLEAQQLITQENEQKCLYETHRINKEQAQTQWQALEKQVLILRNEAEQLREKIELDESEEREQQKEYQHFMEVHYQTKSIAEKLQLRLDTATKRLQQEFECDYEQAVLRKIEIEDKEQARQTVKKLKTSISSLGNINFTAIEEYQEVSERVEFLQTQMSDLSDAKASLDQIIHEMEIIMAQKFKDTYYEVNRIFSEVFHAMFGGGQARLELTDDHDFLHTGIEIIAQPPGKKEKNLTLLSGGERAMTAIALLFALLNVKPSPFCVLDEIEAALDDVNVDRFARFLQDYTAKSQFIIISHRKGTMEAADVLYGVSMENNGVSKLVSVKLSDYEE